ncbi:L-ribulose-5-phosphate 3-epimerase [Aerococcus urinae]
MGAPYRLALYEKALPDHFNLKEKLILAKDMGYDSLEICIDMNEQRQDRLNWTDETWQKLKEFCEDEKIVLYSLSLSALRGCPLGSNDKEKVKKAFTMLEKALSIASHLDITTILVNAYDVYEEESTEETQQRFIQNMKYFSTRAGDNQVVIAIENAEMPFADTGAKVNRLVEKIGSQWVQIYYDFANTFNALEANKKLIRNDFECCKNQIRRCHLKDSLPGDYRHVPYGKGHVDFEMIAELLAENSISEFTAELFCPQGGNWESYSRGANVFLRSYLDVAFNKRNRK